MWLIFGDICYLSNLEQNTFKHHSKEQVLICTGATQHGHTLLFATLTERMYRLQDHCRVGSFLCTDRFEDQFQDLDMIVSIKYIQLCAASRQGRLCDAESFDIEGLLNNFILLWTFVFDNISYCTTMLSDDELKILGKIWSTK